MHFGKLDDSPMFRKQLQALEENAEALRDRCQRFYLGCRKYTEELGEAYDGDIAFASALESFGGGHDDPISVAVGGPVMNKFTIALREIGTYKEVLRSQVEHMLNDRLMQFTSIDLQDVKEVRKRFDKASLHYDQVREKFLSLKKGTRIEIVVEAEEDLRNARSAFEQARFNLVTALSNIEAKKKFEFLESVSGMMDAHLRYFKQGYELLLQMEPYIHQVLTYAQQSRERANYEQAALADRMQEFRRQMERDNQRSFSDVEASPTGDGIHAVGRSSHKMIEAVMQSTPRGKVQTIKQGYLLKRSSSVRGDWKRRFFVLDSRGILYYYRKHWGKPTDDKTIAHDTVNLLTSTIKVDAEQTDLRFCFRIISPTKNYTLQAESAIDRVDWIDKITGVIASLLNSQIPVQGGYSQRLPRSPMDSGHQRTASESSSLSGSSDFDHTAFEDSATSRNQFAVHQEYSLRGSLELQERPIDVLRRVPGNEVCADCSSPEPDWASLNLGILLCIECSGVHRNLGVHISKVRSLTLDVKVWEPSVINLFQSIGNLFANSIWEELFSNWGKDDTDTTERNHLNEEKEEIEPSFVKPDARDPLSTKEKFIHAKYAEKRFLLRSKFDQRVLSVACRIWNAVQANNKQIVYGLIVCFDADVNTTYEQAMAAAQVDMPKVGPTDNWAGMISHSGTSRSGTLDNSGSPMDPNLDANITARFGRASLSTKTLDSVMDGLKMDGWTLLHLACYVDDMGMAELLLQYGAQVNAQDSQGRTPLHHGILYRRNAIAKLLLARGATPAALDTDGKTPLQTAMELGAVTDEELFVLLS